MKSSGVEVTPQAVHTTVSGNVRTLADLRLNVKEIKDLCEMRCQYVTKHTTVVLPSSVLPVN
jgi:hypothetical protein